MFIKVYSNHVPLSMIGAEHGVIFYVWINKEKILLFFKTNCPPPKKNWSLGWDLASTCDWIFKKEYIEGFKINCPDNFGLVLGPLVWYRNTIAKIDTIDLKLFNLWPTLTPLNL